MLPTEKEWERIDSAMYSLDERHAAGTAVQNLFFLGCMFHAEGNKEAGAKAIDTALKAINLDRENKSLFLKIVDNIEGNELSFAHRVQANVEFKWLFPRET